MTPAFEKLQKHLRQLPGLGYRSSERIALHLLVEKPARLAELNADAWARWAQNGEINLFNGYSEDHVKPELKPMIEKFRRPDAPVTIDGPIVSQSS